MPLWTADTSVDSICWSQLSVDTQEDDIDFVLRVSAQYPMCISDETARTTSVHSLIRSP